MGKKEREGEMKLPSVKAVTFELDPAVWEDLREDWEESTSAPSLPVGNASERFPSLQLVRSWMLRLRVSLVV